VETSDKILLLEEFSNVTGKDGGELVGVATTPTANFTHLVYLKRSTLTPELAGPIDWHCRGRSSRPAAGGFAGGRAGQPAGKLTGWYIEPLVFVTRWYY